MSSTRPTETTGTPAANSREMEFFDRPRHVSLGMNILGVVRILLGLYLLWAFFDKLFGWTFNTPPENAWIRGGSPTTGFLGGVADPASGNPFAGFFEFWLSLNPVTDILFMAGLLGVGLSFTLGIVMRIGAVSGCAMYLLMYMAVFPLVTNPILDDRLIKAVLMLGLAALLAGDYLGLGRPWRRLVRNNPVLV